MAPGTWLKLLVGTGFLSSLGLACEGDSRPDETSNAAGSSSTAGGRVETAGSGGSESGGRSTGSGGLLLGGSSSAGSPAAGGDPAAGGEPGASNGQPDVYCSYQEPSVCACDVDDAHSLPATDVVCSESPNFYCCTHPNYPNEGGCDCSAWGCEELDGYCSCLFTTDVQAPVHCTTSYAHCCRTPGNPYACVCSDADCAMGQQEVPDCTIDDVGCEFDEVRTESYG